MIFLFVYNHPESLLIISHEESQDIIFKYGIPSRNDCYSLLLKMAIEIVDFPMKNCDFPVRYVKLPEGTRMMCVRGFLR